MAQANFFIVGAAKAGTTTLYDSLAQHPDIFMSPIKEPCYFSDGWPHWISSRENYGALFEGAGHETILGEASTTYLDDPQSPQRIHRYTDGKARILISLRNPADRAFSQWEHSRYHENVENLEFDQALKAEDQRLQDYAAIKKLPSYRPGLFLYFRQGLYAEKVKAYVDTFGHEQVMVIVFEEWLAQPQAYLQRICAFLDIATDITFSLDNSNPPHTSRLRFLSDFLQSPPPLLMNLYQRFPNAVQESIFKTTRALYWANQKTRRKNQLDPQLREMLLERYQPDIQALEALLQRDLSVWYSG